MRKRERLLALQAVVGLPGMSKTFAVNMIEIYYFGLQFLKIADRQCPILEHSKNNSYFLDHKSLQYYLIIFT